MTYLIWISVISSLILVLMLSYRYFEITKGKRLISTELRNKSDQKILTFHRKSIILLNRFFEKIKVKVVDLPHLAGDKLHNWWQIISTKVDSIFEKFKGEKKTIGSRGSVSLYWQSISEGRHNKK